MNHRTPETRRGFTLIELLAVVAIIILLLSLLIPGLKRAKEMSLDSRCKSNLRQIGSLQINFAQDNDGVLPAGGSVGSQHGAGTNQTCWMGKEVLVGSPFESTNFKNTPWPEGRFGTLFPYLGGDVALAKNLYRCIAQPTGELGSGEGSNGYFDYSMIMMYGGATLGYIPLSATLRHTAAASTWEKKRTPLVVEEDPYWWLNSGANMEPGHGNRDKIGVWHYGHGNYVAVDGSVSDCRPLVAGQLNPDLNSWYITGPSGVQTSMGSHPGYNSWINR